LHKKIRVGITPWKDLPRISPVLTYEQFREISQYAYRILYEIRADKNIDVLAVIHKRMDFKAEDLP
jgi:plasmid stabilization system protein ParE